MALCARKGCGRWRPNLLARLGGLGLYLDDAWYCSPSCLEAAARMRLSRTPRPTPAVMPAVPALRVGALLARQNRIEKDVIRKALELQRKSGLRLGAQLVEMGVVSSYDVLRALAAQAGVGCLTAVDCARLLGAPGNLSNQAARSLGLVPFEADHVGQRLKVACTAPLPRVALTALRQLTGYAVEPYLVGDDQWPELIDAYGASPTEGAPAQVRFDDIHAAAARVARAARNSPGLRMAETRFDPFLWVRLQAAGRTEDLWLPAGK